ncbi:MAG: hypothetical protein JKY27_07845, partial [Magnetovibrio sp.]|nr:hypothetical protein [Magnetovibrio sp.]
QGRTHDPALAGQYTNYLKKQFKDMLEDERMHPRPKRIIEPLSPQDIQNLLAYLSILDD